MEKVKITREQKEALVQINLDYGRNAFSNFMGGWRETDPNYKVFKDFTPEQFMKLTCDWYEVEGVFQVGDWVCDTELELNKCIFYKIDRIDDEHTIFTNGEWESTNNVNDYFEKVTEPWKIMLLELGREKPEFKVNDVYIMSCGTPCRIKNERGFITIKNDLEAGRVIGFHSMESRIEVNACGK